MNGATSHIDLFTHTAVTFELSPISTRGKPGQGTELGLKEMKGCAEDNYSVNKDVYKKHSNDLSNIFEHTC